MISTYHLWIKLQAAQMPFIESALQLLVLSVPKSVKHWRERDKIWLAGAATIREMRPGTCIYVHRCGYNHFVGQKCMLVPA